MEQDATVRRRQSRRAGLSSEVDQAGDSVVSPLVPGLLERLSDGPVRFVARAPGRLDVMGGLAECTGCLVLNTTIADHVCVVVQARTDGVVSIESVAEADGDNRAPQRVRLCDLRGSDGSPVPARQGLGLLKSPNDVTVRCVLGTLVEMLGAKLVDGFGGGLTVVLGSTLSTLSEVGREATVVAGTLAGASRAMEVELDPLKVVALCRCVEREWLGEPVGAASALCALVGERDTLMQLRSEASEPAVRIRLPGDLAFRGIDCGARHPDARAKYERARTSAFMGRLLIERIIEHEGGNGPKWDRQLSRLSVTDYVERFRDRIPTKLRGEQFLNRFGETGDWLTRIDPGFVYKVRSRTEHHIYEHSRSRQFVECLARAIRNNDEGILVEAGALMYASHWSYGQRCGLGSVKTDLLVNLLRKQEGRTDIYGARVSGRGCGGVVTVFMRETDRAKTAVGTALEAYKARTGESAGLIRGSSPGALVAGVREL